VLGFYPEAAIQSTMIPGPALPQGETGVPGFRARLVSPEKKDAPPRWIPSGELPPLRMDGMSFVSATGSN
jgi:hypothetical protein